MPDRLTTAEGIDRLSDDIAARLMKLRMSSDKSSPNGNGARSWYERHSSTINVVLGVLLTTSIALVGGVYKSSMDRLDTIEGTASKAMNGVERIDKDRTARLADIDRWRENVETELRTYRVANAEFQQLKGVVGKLGEQLASGREERLKDRETDRQEAQRSREMILGAIGDLKTQVALLRQEARGRRPDDAPFGGENQMWTPPLIDPNLRPPVILKATVNRSRVAARRGGKRPRKPVVLVSLTRSLEKAFGRPHFRGRYWASLGGGR